VWVVKTSDERIKMLFGLCTLASKRNWVRDRYLPVGQFWGFILMCVCVCMRACVRSFVHSFVLDLSWCYMCLSVCLFITLLSWGDASYVCLSVCHTVGVRQCYVCLSLCLSVTESSFSDIIWHRVEQCPSSLLVSHHCSTCVSVCLSQSRREAMLRVSVCLSVCHRVVVRQCYLTQKPTVSIVATGERSWRTTRNSTTTLGTRSSWRGLSSPDTSRNTCMCWTPSPRKVLLCFAFVSANLLFCRTIVKLLCFLPTRHYASVSCSLVSVCNNNNNNNKCICIRS